MEFKSPPNAPCIQAPTGPVDDMKHIKLPYAKSDDCHALTLLFCCARCRELSCEAQINIEKPYCYGETHNS